MSNETARRIPAPDSSAILETPSDVELFTPPPGVRTSTSKPSVADGIVSNVLACVDVNNVSASGVEVDDDDDDVTDEAGNESNPGSAVDVDVEDECRILSVIWGPSFKLASSVEVDDVDDEDDEELDDDKTVDGDDEVTVLACTDIDLACVGTLVEEICVLVCPRTIVGHCQWIDIIVDRRVRTIHAKPSRIHQSLRLLEFVRVARLVFVAASRFTVVA